MEKFEQPKDFDREGLARKLRSSIKKYSLDFDPMFEFNKDKKGLIEEYIKQRLSDEYAVELSELGISFDDALEMVLELNIKDSFERYQKMFSLSEDELNGSLLDVGAGSGSPVKYIRKVLGNSNAFSVDIKKPDMVKNDSGFVVGDSSHLPFKDGEFNVVTARAFVSMFYDGFWGDIFEVLNEMIRVTRVGGKIIFDVSTPKGEKEYAESEKDSEYKKLYDGLIERYNNSVKFFDYLEQLKQKGFNVEQKSIRDGMVVVTIIKPK